MRISEQTRAVSVIRVSIAQRGEHGREIGLLLPGDAALVRQLVRHRGGEVAAGRVHIDVRLRRKGEEKAREVEIAHHTRADDSLCPESRAGERGIVLFRPGKDLRRLPYDLRPVGSAEAVFIPRDQHAVAVRPAGEIACDRGELLGRDGLIHKAASRGKIVGIVIHAPEQTEQRIDREAGRDERDERAVQPSPLFSAAEKPDDLIYYVNQSGDHRERDQKLRHGKGHVVIERAERAVERPHGLFGEPGHPLVPSAQSEVQRDQPRRDEQQHMPPRAEREYGGKAAFFSCFRFHGKNYTLFST